ncbi:MAG: PAS domain S-box protein [Syntrophomonas sp.]
MKGKRLITDKTNKQSGAKGGDSQSQKPGSEPNINSMVDFLNFLPDPTLVIDKNHKLIACNRAMEELSGVSASDMLGKGKYEYAIPFYGTRRPILLDLILEPDEEIERDYLYIERGKEVSIVETSGLFVNGQDTFLWGKASLLYDSQGKVVGAIESVRDITERKKAEIALKNSEQRLADIINFLPDPTMVIDREGKVLVWNKAMEETTGVEASYMLGKGNYEYAIPFYGYRRPLLADLILEPDEEIEKDYQVIERSNKELLVIETPVPCLKGKEIFVWGKAALLYDAQGKVIGAIESARDLTERKQAEKDKLEAQERAARAETLASLGLMTTGLAHAIKQPLNSLMMSIDSMLYWHEQGKALEEEEVIEDLQGVLVQASRIDDIIEHMRAFIRNERYAELIPCNLNNSIDKALLLLKAQITSYHINVYKQLEPDLPLILAWESSLEEVIINLLVNAIQSLVQIKRENLTITCITKFEDKVILEVIDNGVGISEKNINKIFETFFTTKEKHSMGMGLFVTKSIIATLNGTISCSSTEESTCFRVEFPPYKA